MVFFLRGRIPQFAMVVFQFSLLSLFAASGAESGRLSAEPRTESLFLVPAPQSGTSRMATAKTGSIRSVELNPKVQSASGLGAGDRLEIPLATGEVRSVSLSRVVEDVNGTVAISGNVEESQWGYFVLATTGTKSVGMLSLPESGEAFEIRPAPEGGHLFAEAPEVPDWVCEAMEPPPVPEEQVQRQMLQTPGTQQLSEPVTIDILIVYTPAARQWADSYAGGIFNAIALSMAKSNLVLDNSGTFLSWNLVGAVEVDYQESGNSRVDLIRLTSSESFRPYGNFWEGYPLNGYLDEVHGLRDSMGADLVTMFAAVNDTGGLAWILNSTAGAPEWGFSLVRVQQITTSLTLPHELGHNMGLHHHRDQNYQPGPGIFSYSAGWRWTATNSTRYSSAMTYGIGSYFDDGITHIEVPYFSNPDIMHEGAPTGHATLADNARTLRELKHVIAGYRQRIDLTIGEAIGQPEWEWRTGGHASWKVGGSGVGAEGYAAQSGAISNSEESWLEVEVEGPGNLHFSWRVSSEANYDFLLFDIGGAERARISGETGWQRETFSIPAGIRTLRWRYSKDRSVSQGGDAGWIDDIVWEPSAPGNPSTYEEWLVTANLPPNEQGVHDDPGGFGIPNWQRYAFGLDPYQPERERLPRAEIRRLLVEGLSEDYLAIWFPKSSAISDLEYRPEVSEDLVEWKSIMSPEFLVEILENGDSQRAVVYRDREPISSGQKRFMRVSLFSKLGEAVGQAVRDWRTGGTLDWTVQENEVDGLVVRSGAITHNQQTWLETTFNGPGTLRFWWKVSSEAGWDFLSFLINGEKITEISGEVDWEERTFLLSPGQQTVRWQYAKDGTSSNGADAGWIQQVEWEPGEEN